MATASIDIKFNTPDPSEVNRPFDAARKGAETAAQGTSKAAESFDKLKASASGTAHQLSTNIVTTTALNQVLFGAGTAMSVMGDQVFKAKKAAEEMEASQKGLTVTVSDQAEEMKKSRGVWIDVGQTVKKTAGQIADAAIDITTFIGKAVLLTGVVTGLGAAFGAYSLHRAISGNERVVKNLGNSFIILKDSIGGFEEDWRRMIVQVSLKTASHVDDTTDSLRQLSFYIQQSGFDLEQTEVFLTQFGRSLALYEVSSEDAAQLTQEFTKALEENKVTLSLIKTTLGTSPALFDKLAGAAENAGHNISKFGESRHEVALALGELAEAGELGYETMEEFNKAMLNSEDISEAWANKSRTAAQIAHNSWTYVKELWVQLLLFPVVPVFALKYKKIAGSVLGVALAFEILRNSTGDYAAYSEKVESERLKQMSNINRSIDEWITKAAEGSDILQLLTGLMDIRYGVEENIWHLRKRNTVLEKEASQELLQLLKDEVDVRNRQKQILEELTEAIKQNDVDQASALSTRLNFLAEEYKDVKLKIEKAKEYNDLIKEQTKLAAEQAQEEKGAHEQSMSYMEYERKLKFDKMKEEIRNMKPATQGLALDYEEVANKIWKWVKNIGTAQAATEDLDVSTREHIRTTEDLQVSKERAEDLRKANVKLTIKDQADILKGLDSISKREKNSVDELGRRYVQLQKNNKLQTEITDGTIKQYDEVIAKIKERARVAEDSAIREVDAEKKKKEILKETESLIKSTASEYLRKYENILKYEDAVTIAKQAESDLERKIWEEIAKTIKETKQKKLIMQRLAEISAQVSTEVREHEEKHKYSVKETTKELERQGDKGKAAKDKIAEATQNAITMEERHAKAVEHTEKQVENVTSAIEAFNKAEKNNQKLVYEGWDWRTKKYVEEHNQRVQARIDAKEAAEQAKKDAEAQAELERELAREAEERVREAARKEEERLRERARRRKEWYEELTELAEKYERGRRTFYTEEGKRLETLEEWQKGINREKEKIKQKKESEERTKGWRVTHKSAPPGYAFGTSGYTPPSASYYKQAEHEERKALRKDTMTSRTLDAVERLLLEGARVEDVDRRFGRGGSAGEKGFSIIMPAVTGTVSVPIGWQEFFQWLDPSKVSESLVSDTERSGDKLFESAIGLWEDSGIRDGREELRSYTHLSFLEKKFFDYLSSQGATFGAEKDQAILKMVEGAKSDFEITDQETAALKKAVTESIKKGAPVHWSEALKKLIEQPYGLADLVVDELLGIQGIRHDILRGHRARTGIWYDWDREHELPSVSRQEALDVFTKTASASAKDIIKQQLDELYPETVQPEEGAEAESVAREEQQQLNEEQTRRISLLENQVRTSSSFSQAIAREVAAIGQLPDRGMQVQVMIDPTEVTRHGLQSNDTDLQNTIVNNSNTLIDSNQIIGQVEVVHQDTGTYG